MWREKIFSVEITMTENLYKKTFIGIAYSIMIFDLTLDNSFYEKNRADKILTGKTIIRIYLYGWWQYDKNRRINFFHIANLLCCKL
jgi:hypothetical protein